MRIFIRKWFVPIVVLTASCTKGTVPEEGAAPIAFRVEAGDLPASRAPGEVDDLSLDGYSFGVLAYNTGRYSYADSNVNPNFMYNEDVTYSAETGRWSYSPVKYWPNGEGEASLNTGINQEYLTFFAYAPYSDMKEDNPAGYCIPTISAQTEVGNPWLVYRIHADVTQQVDLLYAAPLLDQVKPEVDDRVQFNFKHALACVAEKVSVSCSPAMTYYLDEESAESGVKIQVILNTVRARYHLTERARLPLWNTGPTARWQPVLNGELTTDRTVTYGKGLEHCLYSTLPEETEGAWSTDEGVGVFYIPLDMEGDPQTVALMVDYTVRRISGDGTADITEHRESSFPLNRYPEAFAPGKKLSNVGIVIL